MASDWTIPPSLSHQATVAKNGSLQARGEQTGGRRKATDADRRPLTTALKRGAPIAERTQVSLPLLSPHGLPSRGLPSLAACVTITGKLAWRPCAST